LGSTKFKFSTAALNISLEGWCVFPRAPRARASVARAGRARMFVTSRVPFRPTQQYKRLFPAVCTLIYTLN
jgi:hypothetical protein